MKDGPGETQNQTGTDANRKIVSIMPLFKGSDCDDDTWYNNLP